MVDDEVTKPYEELSDVEREAVDKAQQEKEKAEQAGGCLPPLHYKLLRFVSCIHKVYRVGWIQCYSRNLT